MMAKILILLSFAVFSTSLITEGFYQFEDGQVVYIKPLTVEQKAQVLGCDLECANTCFATKTGEEAIACEKDCGCIDILGGSNQLKFWKIPFFGNVDMDDQDEKSEEEDEEGEEENEEEEEENEEEESEEENEEEESEEEESNGSEIEESVNKQDEYENQNSEQEEESVPVSDHEEEEGAEQAAETNPEATYTNSEEADASEENNQESSSQEEEEEVGQSEESISESTPEAEETLPAEAPSSEEESSNPDIVVSEVPTPTSEEQPITIENQHAKEEASNESNIELPSSAQDSSQTLIKSDSSITELSSCNKECLTFCSKMSDSDTACVSQCMSNLCGQNSPKIATLSSEGFWNIFLTFLVSICIIYFIYRKLYPSKQMRRRRNHEAFYQSASDYVQI
ncbi:unnamed protein product [Blepharisma stoltei]|uniref:Uncharacterized protein n=1 Tax=Blepharisma stoltei TaxID=1481888 RepID=A0AAU9JSZ1_9CILI|nr:unnamed protein product [Blepharisma stoltei]